MFKGEKRIFGFRGRGFQVGGAERHTVRPGKDGDAERYPRGSDRDCTHRISHSVPLKSGCWWAMGAEHRACSFPEEMQGTGQYAKRL